MMAGFWERILGRGGKGSGATAKARLQFVLVHDRINLPPEKLALMKQEILAVISKYVNVDEDHVDIALQQGDSRGSMLIAEIPFTKANEDSDVDENYEAPSALLMLDTTADTDTNAIVDDEAQMSEAETQPNEPVEEKKADNDKTEPHKP
jgi:cell division topological specificity factor